MKKTAFTLLEVLIVVVMLGILAALAIPMYTDAVDKQKGLATINNLQTIIAAEKIYRINKGSFWPPSGWLDASYNQINNNLSIQITENNFRWTTNNYYLDPPDGPSNYFEILTYSKWTSTRYYITLRWNITNGEIDWTYRKYGASLQYWFDRFPDTIPENNHPGA